MFKKIFFKLYSTRGKTRLLINGPLIAGDVTSLLLLESFSHPPYLSHDIIGMGCYLCLRQDLLRFIKFEVNEYFDTFTYTYH